MFNFLRRKLWYHIYLSVTHMLTELLQPKVGTIWCIYAIWLCTRTTYLTIRQTSKSALEWWHHPLTVKLHKMFTWWHQWSLCMSADSCANTSRDCSFKHFRFGWWNHGLQGIDNDPLCNIVDRLRLPFARMDQNRPLLVRLGLRIACLTSLKCDKWGSLLECPV